MDRHNVDRKVTDRFGNLVKPGEMVLWVEKDILLEIVALQDDRIVFAFSLPMAADPGGDKAVAMMDFAAVRNPIQERENAAKTDAVLDRVTSIAVADRQRKK